MTPDPYNIIKEGELREEFVAEFSEDIDMETVLKPDPRIADWWINKLTSLLINLLEADIEELKGMKKREGRFWLLINGKTGKAEITQEGWDKGAKHYQIIGYNSALTTLLTTKQALLEKLRENK